MIETSELSIFKTAVYTSANNREKKPNATIKLRAVNELIEHCHALSLSPAGLPTEVFVALTTLYSQHLPKTPAKPKTATAWVFKAIAKNDVRYYLNSANIEGRVIRATDGHRVHVAPHGGQFKNGYYDVALNRVDIDAKFPDIARVIPQASRHRVEVLFNLLTSPTITTIKGLIVAELRAPQMLNNDDKGFYINLKYLKDALSNPAELQSATMGESCMDSLLLNFSDDSLAVIMTVRP